MEDMRPAIIKLLEENKGGMSITEMHRQLVAKGSTIHRLVLTGYLHALAHLGYLSVESRPPSLIFNLPKGNGLNSASGREYSATYFIDS